MTEQHDPKPGANDVSADDAADCIDGAAQRAGAKQSSLKQNHEASTEPDPDKDDVSEDDLDEAIEESMDASDPPSFTQP